MDLEARSQFETNQTPAQAREMVDARRYPRYKLEVEIRVYPRDCPVVRGYTVDISESGISAMLRVEVPVGEVLRLEFALPLGDVELVALVRHQNAFRYGFSSWKPVRRKLSSRAPAASWQCNSPCLGFSPNS